MSKTKVTADEKHGKRGYLGVLGLTPSILVKVALSVSISKELDLFQPVSCKTFDYPVVINGFDNGCLG